MNFRERVLRREPLIGTHISLGNFAIADIFSLCGYDFIWIDTEHAAIDYTELLACVRIIQAHGVAAVVRAHVENPNHTKRLLDMGIDGIVFPQIDTVERAKDAISSCLYPPNGVRGFGPHAAIHYGMRDVNDYVKRSKDELAVFLQVESAKAVENLEGICSLFHADGFIIGPCDFSLFVSGTVEPKGEKALSEIRKAIDIARTHNKSIGISLSTTDIHEQRFWIEQGLNFISSGTDIEYLQKGALHNAKQLREIMKRYL